VLSAVRALLAPRLLALHAVAVAATVAAVLLGVWQYHAWQLSREDRAVARADAPARPLADVMTADAAFPGDAVGQPVELSGRWLPASTMYVADRDLDGRRGVWAVTPVAVCDVGDDCARAPAMLVVRGWAPRVADAPAPPSGDVDVTGWLQPGEGSGVPDPDRTDDVLPELRLADAVQQVDQDLYGGYVIARTPVTEGLSPVTPASLPAVGAGTGLRNLLYALEWWAFGGFAVFMWWRWCRDELQRPDGDGDPREPGVVPEGTEPARAPGVPSGT
jgi:cytochrome oxidase assembly protein ShyY1